MAAFNSWISSAHGYSLVVALVTGTLFGVAIVLAMRVFSRKAGHELPAGLEPDDIVIAGPANHFLGIEVRGGYLYLTEAGLWFKPHKFNIQSDIVSVPWARVVKVGESATMGLLPNGIVIELDDGTMHRFVVARRREWLEIILDLTTRKPAA